MKQFLIPAIIVCLLSCPATAGAQDWETCHKALKELRVASRRASFETLETHRKEKQLTVCLDMIRTIDPCHTLRNELQFQRERVQSALAHLQAAIFQVELSCCQALPLGPEGSPKGDPDKLLRDMCAQLKSATQDMTPEERTAFCKKVHFPGDCSECLGPRSNAADTNPGE